MLIFHRFRSVKQARAFMKEVEERFKRKTYFFSSQESSDESDEFPYVLRPPIVHVERRDWLDDPRVMDRDSDEEAEVEDLVGQFGGVFAGT